MEILIKKEHFLQMPWKNGQGVTQEIDIFPENADFSKGDFHWRLSSAEIKSDTSFSQFPGYDRHLVVLSKDGIRLNERVLSPLDVYSFHGEDLIQCSLLAGPIVDLGIIYRRDLYSCEMKILTVFQNEKIFFGEGIHYLKSISATMVVNSVSVISDEVYKIEGSEIADIQCATYPLQILKISIVMKSAK